MKDMWNPPWIIDLKNIKKQIKKEPSIDTWILHAFHGDYQATPEIDLSDHTVSEDEYREIWKRYSKTNLYISNYGNLRQEGKIIEPKFHRRITGANRLNQKFYKTFIPPKERNPKGVHREVARLFIPNPKKLPCIYFRDGDYHNCCYKNLYWGGGRTYNQ